MFCYNWLLCNLQPGNRISKQDKENNVDDQCVLPMRVLTDSDKCIKLQTAGNDTPYHFMSIDY